MIIRSTSTYYAFMLLCCVVQFTDFSNCGYVLTVGFKQVLNQCRGKHPMLFRLLLKTCETLKDQYVYRPSDISYKRAPFCILTHM